MSEKTNFVKVHRGSYYDSDFDSDPEISGNTRRSTADDDRRDSDEADASLSRPSTKAKKRRRKHPKYSDHVEGKRQRREDSFGQKKQHLHNERSADLRQVKVMERDGVKLIPVVVLLLCGRARPKWKLRRVGTKNSSPTSKTCSCKVRNDAGHNHRQKRRRLCLSRNLLRTSLDSGIWNLLRTGLDSGIWNLLRTGLDFGIWNLQRTGLDSEIWNLLRTGLDSGIWNLLRTGLDSGIWNLLRTSLDSGIWNLLRTGLDSGIWNLLRTGLEFGIWNLLRTGLDSGIWNLLRTGLDSGIWNLIRTGLDSGIWNLLRTSLDSGIWNLLRTGLEFGIY
ncbi:uncharacterized protein LOC115225379 isoform X3 [Octopus sinensis]|uniref:Uncharacterized protein LOC115225379 isoform X3 n=1 Tax=Octopus sinensis TaxID=2607531 RepID=A0A7E6FQP1_9MOLL|nr:uncharacterized protein LOC115225379 isoform X3 [Octopus sinensis]